MIWALVAFVPCQVSLIFLFKLDQNGPNLSKIDQTCPKWIKYVQNEPQRFYKANAKELQLHCKVNAKLHQSHSVKRAQHNTTVKPQQMY